ncbi:conserved hypothetical protein [Pseudarthrobacter chlorophenolicus A6]|uniref:Uncharacterized protein n=1 Tax=Pseudarthrobacter chlorophenolicus (strain ATCC 700700 / DSM 12829 / CIP 107037 / JCM 12360 / KCTC 9906 / NCIMB 13794 / A6) TaxID=452863 RepID=B8H797_PSECP|nr:hypothetical protein [Pseudarthrobacter chlorophenolicus]ACL41699.1 conserved hypothetical protein [Pseudarthrobacter chlorophenolicus A6]SDQ59850.1 hypothetical protein SAMN04489738_1727 [Pseudarthrobacter chlorophenolicus]
MENPDTLVLNLTFLGTVGVAFLIFFVLFLLGVITLLLAGVGRLAAIVLMRLFGKGKRKDGMPLVQLYGTRLGEPESGNGAAPGSVRPSRGWAAALKPARLKSAFAKSPLAKSALGTAVARKSGTRREQAVLAEDWASAVAEADARATARERAANPEIKLSVRDLPDPAVPAEKVESVAPLVESALHNHRPVREVPHSFTKPKAPQVLPPLDTGSLVSLSAQQVLKHGQDQKRTESDATARNGGRPLP